MIMLFDLKCFLNALLDFGKKFPCSLKKNEKRSIQSQLYFLSYSVVQAVSSMPEFPSSKCVHQFFCKTSPFVRMNL